MAYRLENYTQLHFQSFVQARTLLDLGKTDQPGFIFLHNKFLNECGLYIDVMGKPDQTSLDMTQYIVTRRIKYMWYDR